MSTDPNPNQENPDAGDELRLATVLRSVAADQVAPDASFLTALRQKTLDQFAEQALPSIAPKSGFWYRALAGIVATAALILIGLFLLNRGSASAAPQLTAAIDELRQAKTLQLKVTKQGETTDVWIRSPGQARWEESPQHYQIANGARWWKIDETDNTASTEKPPAYLDPQQPIDLLRMLNLGIRDESLLMAAGAGDATEYDGKKCIAYRAVVSGQNDKFQIAAFADAATNRLLAIEARPLGAPAIGPPLAQIQLVALNAPVDESKFVVAKSLTEDGRIGKIVDAQGLIVLRPALASRWTPVGRETLLKMGDWLRTDIRGANAAKIRLSSEAELTLGPGTLLEVISPTKARLHTGEVQSILPQPAGGLTFELLGPREGSRSIKSGSKELVRIDREEKLVDVKEEPIWLKGFEGTSTNESLGSLIVNLPDGGTEPLSVGYHKVNVEIRDQIARTTIEESFVNHTPSRWEGVFYFPLPQDASISGFGVWIGNDLIEADVVEKQRAREIYETILREKRDPGLLEWTSGNLFKARVFPIEAHSEKRIKIVYTQVLPLRANRYRYSYGLRSDLLRTTPLRELSVSVQVNSALPLKSVTCPTHTVRTQQAAHSAQVDFAAQEYIPDRDFEVVCEIDGRNSDVVVVPHRRGDDGYLLLQITPPGKEGNWQREILPDGKSLQVVLLCDTSASMDSEKRKQQAEFVATVLASLGEKDRFLLAAADVETTWVSPEPMAATPENIDKAREFLDQRISLGWTNLDQAFAAVLKQAPADSQIVYIGDGIVTAGEANPVTFVKHLGELLTHSPTVPVSLHAVTVGNTSDSTVLRGIAAAGHGSVRAISGEQTPQIVAKELLNEIAQPGLSDLTVEFRGLKVAAVYPDNLPRVPAGTQQILVGRYLPTGKDQHGEVIVTGKLGGELVRYATQIDLKDAEDGNSFIPRLWARAHLDHLLEQGQSESIRDQIIALSEQFHIITPYTSLLVLETDADRERFGVKRRFEMRDGERFFAEGRANANYELLQQQMKRAGDWRIGLRRQVLQNLMALGRNQQLLQQQTQVIKGLPMRYGGMAPASALEFGRMAGEDRRRYLNKSFDGESLTVLGNNLYDGETEIAGGSLAADGWGFLAEGRPVRGLALGGGSRGGIGGGGGGFNAAGFDFNLGDFNGDLSLADRFERDKKAVLGWEPPESGAGFYQNDEVFWRRGPANRPEAASSAAYPVSGELPMAFSDSLFLASKPVYETKSREIAYTIAKPVYSRWYSQPNYTAWLDTLFPALAEPAPKPTPPKISDGWSADARALVKGLLRTDALQKLAGGLELRRTDDNFDPRWNRRSAEHTSLVLYSPKAWLTRPTDLDGQTVVNYCTDHERGVYSLALMLGRTRKSVERDLATPPLDLNDWSLAALDESYPGFKVRVETAGEKQQALILSDPNSKVELRFLIDTTRHVLLKQENFNDGKLTGTVVFDDFVEIGGTWWARSVTSSDEKGGKTAETKLGITLAGPEQFLQRINEELAAKPQAEFLHLPLVPLKIARQKVADGSAGFDDRITMMLSDAMLQEWDDLFQQLDAAEKAAAGKPGVRWLRPILLATSRRNDDARKWLLGEAKDLAAKKQQDEIYLADFIFGQSQGVASPAEQLEFIQLLKPISDRQPAELDIGVRWQERTIGCDDALGRIDEALELRHQLAEHLPWDLNKQIDYARHLLQMGQAEKAYAWLQAELDRKVERTDSEDDQLRTAYADLFRTQARWEDLLKFTSDWIKRNPPYQSAYSQHLSALLFNDQLDAANKLAEQWLKEARIEGDFQPDLAARLEVAILFAQGNCYNIWSSRMDDRWYQPLAEAVRYYLEHKKHFDIVQRMYDGRLAGSDAGDRLRGLFLKLLQTQIESLSPQQISTLVSWALSGRMELAAPIDGRTQLDAGEIPNSVWQAIAKNIRDRWNKTSEHADKHLLGESLHTIYSSRFSDTELLPFLRERIESAPAEYKSSYKAVLFDTLLGRNWTDDIEQEAFRLLPQLSDSNDAGERLMVQVPALYRLVDAMISQRQAAAERTLHDQGKTDELTRTELMKKKAEFAKLARTEVAKRLGEEAAKANPSLAPWLRMEQAYLDVQLDQNLATVEEMCWQILGEVPQKFTAADAAGNDVNAEVSPAQIEQHFFDALLHQRAFATVMNLAARRNAAPATIKRVQQYIDAGIAQAGDAAALWRVIKFQLLVALDQPDELETQLRSWIRDDVSTAPWRNALAMLLAERGKLDEAIQLFEASEKDHLLFAADYRMLADWYLVTARRDGYERTKLEAFKTLPENALANTMYGLRNRWLSGIKPLPSELDENTLLALRALFAKSAAPENYLWQLRDLYGACRDFRLLQILPDAVLGRSPQQIYSFLQNMQNQILGELRNEATADEIISRIKTLREKQTKPTDLRALDLFEAMIERRAAEVLNQPGPHVDACVAAMKRAFDRQWGDGEPRLMASYLKNLGTLPKPPMVDEQLRELRALQNLAAAGSRDHLQITNELCNLIFWSYGRHEAALAEMEIEVRGYEQAHHGQWPNEDNGVLGDYVHLLEGANQHAAGETVLQKYLAHPENDDQRNWLRDRLLALYNDALDHDGEVSLGKGNELFLQIVAEGQKQLDASPDENVRHGLVGRLVNAFEIAHKHNLPSAVVELQKFAFTTMPAVLKRQQGQYRNTVSAPLNVIGETLGQKFAVQYIVERLEQYPQRLEITWDSGWNVFGFELARRRQEAADAKADLADLEPRVLRLAVAELQRELRIGEYRNQHMFYIGWQYFWAAKTDDFARAAEEVYTSNKTSGRTVGAVANYLWNGLHRFPRAIEILLIAYHNGVLDEGGQEQLVNWLQEQSRHAESIAILEPLVKAHPDSMHYRCLLMTAYFRSGRPEQLRDLVAQTDAHFHEGGRWTEENVAEFGRTCGGCGLAEKAVGYLSEAISLRQRSQGGQTINDGELSNLYHALADAHTALHHTKAAVEAASAAIVCWGPQQQQRRDATLKLKQVLEAANDLADYVGQLDIETAKTGQDSPILRKAIGQAFQSHQKYSQAAKQFALAIQLQTTDREVYEGLIACDDALGNRADGTRQMERLIDLEQHDVKLYEQLAERLKEQPAEAERAVTSIIEAGPQEAENHTALAEIRQRQDRWDEAIDQWRDVAKLRALEPTGLLRLAEAQIHQKQWDGARQSIEKLQRTEWPTRFGDVNSQTRQLQERLPK